MRYKACKEAGMQEVYIIRAENLTEYQKQEFIISVGDKCPKQVCLSAWGERCDELENIQIGDTVTAELEISSREYNGKWYTEVKAWKFQNINQAPKVQESTQPVQSNAYPKEEVEELF